MNITILELSALALIVMVLINFIFKVNIGLIAYPLAFILGGFGLNLNVAAVVEFFPLNMFIQIMAITLFFGFAVENETVEAFASRFVYAARNKPAFIPWSMFLVCLILGALGCPPPALPPVLLCCIFYRWPYM